MTQKVLTSSKTLADVRTELLSYLEKYIGTRGIGVMAGNSIHQDRMFLAREFPEVIDYLDHRIVDVSSFKEVLKRHNPHLCKLVPKKAQKHTARADILESIDELKWYMNHYLIGRNIQ